MASEEAIWSGSTVFHVVCELNEYIISSNWISWLSEMGVAKLIYSAGQGLNDFLCKTTRTIRLKLHMKHSWGKIFQICEKYWELACKMAAVTLHGSIFKQCFPKPLGQLSWHSIWSILATRAFEFINVLGISIQDACSDLISLKLLSRLRSTCIWSMLGMGSFKFAKKHIRNCPPR